MLDPVLEVEQLISDWRTTMATTETNTAPASAAPAEKPSKMAQARVLFNELIQAETDKTLPEGKSRRQEFIRRAKTEIDLTPNGAITYYNNLQNESKGKPLYIKPKKVTTAQAQGQTEGGEKQELTEEQEAGDAAADAALTGLGDDTPADDKSEEEQEESKAE